MSLDHETPRAGEDAGAVRPPYPVRTIGDLMANLQVFDAETPVYGVYFVEIHGKRQPRARTLTISRERVDGVHIKSGDTSISYSFAIWSALDPASGDPECVTMYRGCDLVDRDARITALKRENAALREEATVRAVLTPEPPELAGLLLARKILASVGYECSVADHALQAEVARIRAKGGKNVALREPDAPDGGGDEESTWLMPLMDAFETACDAYAHRTQHVDAAADAAEEAARIKSINDARFALRNAVRAALRRATPRDGGTVGVDLRPGLETAVEIANQAYREMTKQTPWDEGMRDMAVRISHRLRDRLATEHGEG